MEKIKVNVQWCDDNFGAALENVPGAVVVTAKTYDKLKQEVSEALRLHMEEMESFGDEVPEWWKKGDYMFDYVLTDAGETAPTRFDNTLNNKTMAKRFFRPHRALFADSMAEKTEVSGIEDIVRRVDDDALVRGYFKNVRIAADTWRPHRCPDDEWGEDTYMVVADFDGYTKQCIGFANFKEE